MGQISTSKQAEIWPKCTLYWEEGVGKLNADTLWILFRLFRHQVALCLFYIRSAPSFPTDSTPLPVITAYTVRRFAIMLVNMPIATWAMNSLDNRKMNHSTSVNNMMR